MAHTCCRHNENSSFSILSPLLSRPIVLTLRAIHHLIAKYDRDGDNHYDFGSAFIKSIPGCDVDATLHYSARILEAGKEKRFIARRVMISASEDIGLADPGALDVAAAQTLARVGMLEARIILAEAVTYLAAAPKSNAAYLGIESARC